LFAQTPQAAQAPQFLASALWEWRSTGDGLLKMNLVGGDSPSPTELATYRRRFPAGAFDSTKATVHYHLATIHVIVLKGTLVIGFGDHVDYKNVREYTAGGFFVVPSGKPHYEWARGETETQVEAIGPTKLIPFVHLIDPPPQFQPSARDTTPPLPNGLPQWNPNSNGSAVMRLAGNMGSPTELVAFRIHYPASFMSDTSRITYHYHFGTEHITVLKGTLYLGIGDHVDRSKAKAYGPGSFIELTAGTPHFEWFGEVEAHIEAVGPLSAVPLDPATGQPR
jgi:quercetin dioxygenase-like cupin family protein